MQAGYYRFHKNVFYFRPQLVKIVDWWKKINHGYTDFSIFIITKNSLYRYMYLGLCYNQVFLCDLRSIVIMVHTSLCFNTHRTVAPMSSIRFFFRPRYYFLSQRPTSRCNILFSENYSKHLAQVLPET